MKRVDWFGLGCYLGSMGIVAWAVSDGEDGHTVLFGAALVMMVYGLVLARSILGQLEHIRSRAETFHVEARDEVVAQTVERERVQVRDAKD